MIPIVCCFDINMLLPAQVCFFSLFANAQQGVCYDVFVVYRKNELSSQEKISFELLLQNYPSHRISFIGIADFFQDAYEVRNITVACYYRLLIPSMMEQINAIHHTEYRKVIYLDVDTIVECDLSKLYEVEFLENEWIAGVCETPLYNNSDTSYHEIIGCDPNTYINSGLLVMDTEKMNEVGFYGQCVAHHDKKYICQDQDIINIVCKGHIRLLPLKYNFTTILYRLSLENMPFKEKKRTEIDDAAESVVHYTGEKPWHSYCLRDYVWWFYFMKSPYADQTTYMQHYSKIRSLFIDTAPSKILFSELLHRIDTKLKKRE